MKAGAVIVALAVALVLQTTLGRLVSGGIVAVDFVLVVVISAALVGGPTAGLLTGTAGGLVQDALSSGVLGIGGLAKSIVGFLTGVAGTQFIVATPLPRMVVFAAATALHAVVFIGVYEMLDLRDFGDPWWPILGQAIGNAVVGTIAAQALSFAPGFSKGRAGGFRR